MTQTVEERLEVLETVMRALISPDAEPQPRSLEDLHADTVAKVKLARERGGLSA